MRPRFPGERRQPQVRRAFAFTLIELLVSIAIIGLLIGILLPALHRGGQLARLTVCVSNIRSVGLTMIRYIHEHDGRMPPRKISFGHGIMPDGEGELPVLFDRFLSRYDGMEFDKAEKRWHQPVGVWRCPEITTSEDNLRETHSGVIHYAPNTWLFNTVRINLATGAIMIRGDATDGWDGIFATSSWRRVERVNRQDRIIAVMDNVNYYNEAHGHREARESIGLACDVLSGAVVPCADNVGSHDGLVRRPTLYLDGHATALTLEPSYWLNGSKDYLPYPGAGIVTLNNRDVQSFLWYVNGDAVVDD